MTDVTDQDRAKARQLLRSIAVGTESTTVEIAAAALAEEREKARAPFKRLADEIEAACRGRQDVVSMTMRDDAALIRVTLDDNQ